MVVKNEVNWGLNPDTPDSKVKYTYTGKIKDLIAKS